MRAVVLSAFGPPGNLAVAEVPDPLPGPGQALVDVHIVSITFVETQVRAGRPPNPAMLPDLPGVLGNGVGGIVAAVGEGGSRVRSGRPASNRAGTTGARLRRLARWFGMGGSQVTAIPPGERHPQTHSSQGGSTSWCVYDKLKT